MQKLSCYISCDKKYFLLALWSCLLLEWITRAEYFVVSLFHIMPWNPIWSTTKVLAHHVRNSYAAVALERNSPVSSGCCSHENADFSVLSNDSLPGQDYGHYDRWSKNYVRKFLSTVFGYIIIMKLFLSCLKHALSRLASATILLLYIQFSIC